MAGLPKQVPVDHVAEGIYISGWRATNHARELAEAGITNVLKLFEDIPYFPAPFNQFENALDDGEYIPREVLKRGVDFVVEHVREGKPVLVMCSAGMSRSATFVLASLLELGYGLRDAFRLLKQNHPRSGPHPELWKSLIDHYDLPFTLAEVHHWHFEDWWKDKPPD